LGFSAVGRNYRIGEEQNANVRIVTPGYSLHGIRLNQGVIFPARRIEHRTPCGHQ